MNPLVFGSVLAAAQGGEEWAWTEIYTWLASPVGSYFRVRGVNDPDDLVGEVFVQIARNVGSFRGDADGFRSWVFMIAHNRLANERRRLGRKPETLVADMADVDWRQSISAEEMALVNEGTDRIREMLDRLTIDQRDVVALRLVGGFTLEKTAEIVGKSLGSVKQLQRRGLDALRSQIAERGITK